MVWLRLLPLRFPARKGRAMPNRSDTHLRFLLCCMLLLSALADGTSVARGAEGCLTAADEIATDRPDVTNSSLVVPRGSLQVENGVDWTVRHGSNAFNGTNTRLRLGIAHCTEFLIDIPNYFGSLNGSQPSGFSNLVVSFKRQLPVLFGFDGDGRCGLSLRLWQNLGARLSAVHTVPLVPQHRRGLGGRRHVHSHLVPQRVDAKSDF